MFKLGFTPDELKDFTGHADDKMINEVYAIYTKDDKAQKAFKAIERITGKKDETTYSVKARITKDNINEQDDLIREIKDALYCLGADLNELADINDYHQLSVILYCKYHYKLMELGIDKDAKEIYKMDKLSLAEKRKAIKELRDRIALEQLASEPLD